MSFSVAQRGRNKLSRLGGERGGDKLWRSKTFAPRSKAEGHGDLRICSYLLFIIRTFPHFLPSARQGGVATPSSKIVGNPFVVATDPNSREKLSRLNCSRFFLVIRREVRGALVKDSWRGRERVALRRAGRVEIYSTIKRLIGQTNRWYAQFH